MRNGLRLLVLLAVATTTVFGPPTTVFAWSTAQSASAFCTGGQTSIGVSFTNKESSRGIDVVATDLQSGASVNLGSVAPGATATGTINTGWTVLSSGTVRFHLTWSDGSSGSDSRTAGYGGVDCTPPEEPPEEGPPPEEPPATPPGPIWTAECIRTIQGQVLDRYNNPVPNMGVALDGKNNVVTYTNAEGYYEFEFPTVGVHLIEVLWEEYNAAHGTSLFFSHPQVTVVVGEECREYPADDLVDPVVVQVWTAPQPQPEARLSLAELRLIRVLEGWDLSGPTRI